MCQSYRKPCVCGQRTAELFFGQMVLDEASVKAVYCPQCSATVDPDPVTMVEDNGWILELDEEVIRAYAPRMNMTPDEVTAEKVFDGDFVTWVGFSPEDNVQRVRERRKIEEQYAGDLKGHFEALKKWALDRERRFYAEGWRKALRKKAAYG
ncbi:hypothetical protein [Deferrisoma sp.]